MASRPKNSGLTPLLSLLSPSKTPTGDNIHPYMPTRDSVKWELSHWNPDHLTRKSRGFVWGILTFLKQNLSQSEKVVQGIWKIMLNLSYGKRCSDLQDESRDKWEEWVKVLRRLDCGKTLAPWKKNYDQPRQHIKKQGQSPSSQDYGFSSSHVWMRKLDYKESWVLKNWCFWTVVLEKTLESPLDCKEIQPFNSKRNQS